MLFWYKIFVFSATLLYVCSVTVCIDSQCTFGLMKCAHAACIGRCFNLEYYGVCLHTLVYSFFLQGFKVRKTHKHARSDRALPAMPPIGQVLGYDRHRRLHVHHTWNMLLPAKRPAGRLLSCQTWQPGCIAFLFFIYCLPI